MNTQIENNLYKTADLPCASALALFCPIRTLEKNGSAKVFFVFEKTKELEDVERKFWNKELRVDPLEFSNQMKSLKTRIYES